MENINFRLGDLRKEKGVTQQEVASALGTSFQTISKWENQVTVPDVTYLPELARFFQVSVDQLLGLVPLPNEEFQKQQSDTEEFWNQKLEYLRRSRKTSWNKDYLQFLIEKVWQLNAPVDILDCGCGYGYFGILMEPYLSEGSTYTGVDFSEVLIEQGKRMFRDVTMESRLIKDDFLQFSSEKKYDVVICQSVLRHVGDAKSFVSKMISFAKKGALIICIDSNRELECAGLYVEGMDYSELCDHTGAAKHWKAEYEKGARDYAAAVRNAFTMRELGIKEVQVRMNDCVNFVHPDVDDYEQLVTDFIGRKKAWNNENVDVTKRLMSHGMTKTEAVHYLHQGKLVKEYVEQHRDSICYSQFRGKTITFGWNK